MDRSRSPKVFISYSWTSEPYVAKVVELARSLREHSIDAILDKWEISPGDDLYAYMEQMVTSDEVDRVLILIDPQYAERSDARRGGVGTEAQIITPELYGKVRGTKFVPVVLERDSNGEVVLPAYLRGRYHIDMSTPEQYDAGYEDLVRLIYDVPKDQKPSLGSRPAWLDVDSDSTVPTTPHSRRVVRLVPQSPRAGIDAFHALLDSALVFVDEQVDAAAVSSEPRHSAVYSAVERTAPLSGDLTRSLRSICRARESASVAEELHGFFERLLSLATGQHKGATWPADVARYVCWELFLVANTVAFEEGAFDVSKELLEESYFPTTRQGLKQFGFTDIEAHVGTLNEDYNRMVLGGNRAQVMADLIRNRVPASVVSFSSIMQTDFFLALRGARVGARNRWWPRTHVYLEGDDNTSFPLVFKAVTEKHMMRLNAAVGTATIGDYVKLVRSVVDQGTIGDPRRPFGPDYLAIGNVEAIKSAYRL